MGRVWPSLFNTDTIGVAQNGGITKEIMPHVMFYLLPSMHLSVCHTASLDALEIPDLHQVPVSPNILPCCLRYCNIVRPIFGLLTGLGWRLMSPEVKQWLKEHRSLSPKTEGLSSETKKKRMETYSHHNPPGMMDSPGCMRQWRKTPLMGAATDLKQNTWLDQVMNLLGINRFAASLIHNEPMQILILELSGWVKKLTGLGKQLHC